MNPSTKSTKSTERKEVKQLRKKEEPKQTQKSTKDLEVLMQRRAKDSNPYGRENVLGVGAEELEQLRIKKGKGLSQESYAFKMITLFEFDNSWLLMQGFGEAYQALVIDLSQQFQKEYDCKTTSERATAHLAAQNYGRTLELQRMISNILHAESYNDLKLRRLAILEKAYDRACTQYAVSMHTLKTIKQIPMNVIVNTLSANVAQQQMVQENINVKAK